MDPINSAQHASTAPTLSNGKGAADPATAASSTSTSTSAAYDLWAPIYDTDGNFLQALDTIQMRRLLPAFLARVMHNANAGFEGKLSIVDLGCGTGRNTLSLLRLASEYGINRIVGLDLSRNMLQIAQGRTEEATRSSPGSQVEVQLQQFDMLDRRAVETIPTITKDATAMISTLVLEHLPLPTYFETCSRILPMKGSRLLITNMHAEMGKVSKAGFIDIKTGEKVSGDSYAHEIGDVVAAAEKEGWVLGGDIEEMGVDSEDMVKLLGVRSRKWFERGVKTWFALEFVRT
jgi:SAM-dependent methyltransferase